MPYREFLLFSNEGRTDAKFNPNRLMEAGRLDIVVHSIIQAFFVSERMRANVRFHLILNGPPDPPKYILLESNQEMPISKKDIGTLLRICLHKYKPGKRVKVFPGVWIEKKYFEDVVDENKGKQIFILDKNGIPIEEVEIDKNKDVLFILGDHMGLPKYAKRYAEKQGGIKVSLGDVVYFTSQCIVILNYILDKINFEKSFYEIYGSKMQ